MTIVEAFQKHKVVRRALMLWMMALTTHVFIWAMGFSDSALTTQRTGIDLAAMIGAITGPLALLQGYVFKLYNEARQEDSA